MTYKEKFKTTQEALEEFKRIGGDLSAFAEWLDSVIPDIELPAWAQNGKFVRWTWSTLCDMEFMVHGLNKDKTKIEVDLIRSMPPCGKGPRSFEVTEVLQSLKYFEEFTPEYPDWMKVGEEFWYTFAGGGRVRNKIERFYNGSVCTDFRSFTPLEYYCHPEHFEHIPRPAVDIPTWLMPGTWIKIRDVLRRVVNVTRNGNVVAIRTNHGPVTLVKTNEDWKRYPIVPVVVTPWTYEQAIGYFKARGAIWNELGEVQLRNVIVERGAWYVTTVSGSIYDPWTLIKFETNKEQPCGNVQ